MHAATRREEAPESISEAPSSETRRRTLALGVRTAPRAIEWPTVLVGVAIYAGWLALTAFSAALPWWLLASVGGFIVAWHGSFQHETIHGHPTRSRRFNSLLGAIPLALWLPYGIYRSQHLAHHRVSTLTDPIEDPESFYVTEQTWAAAGSLRRFWMRLQMTLAGRLIFGPPTVMARFFVAEVRRAVRGDRRYVRAWALHFVGVALLVLWLTLVCHLSIARYLACFVYPGLALSLLRSFAEHRPAALAEERVAIVESGWLFSLLFLNNNLHVVHHDAPALAWYELPARYRATRTEVLATNGNYFFASYARLATRYAFRLKDSPVHPAA